MSDTNTKFTTKQASTLRIINTNYPGATVITRAQIKALVDAGDFAWPYWITDHKFGYVTKRGEFRVPGTEAAAPTEVVATKWFAFAPSGSKVTVKFDEPVTAAYAAEAMIAARERSKKSTKWINSTDLTAVSAS
mgnify:CR=1 FL=1